LIDMDVITPGVNTRRFTLDLEYALGEVKLINGIPDIEFTKVRHVFQKLLLETCILV
jgi:aarF domain-containing kinase